MKLNKVFRLRAWTSAMVWVGCCLVVGLSSGCHTDQGDSATLKEARALNEETNQMGRQFHARLELIREDIQAQVDAGNSDLEDTFRKALATLNDLDTRYASWLSNQVLLPGATCNHDHGDGDHHHHHHETSLDELSDADHLALQKAIRAELEGLLKELNSLTP